MPTHKSAAKRIITNAKAQRRNIANRSRLRSAIKAVRQAANRTDALAAYRTATSVLDRTVAKGVIKKEAANRQKARLALFAQRLPA
ncbi:MAG: 30S ribosomal protein S20 [Candidatus Eisenbacteria bacterium RBG_16_71_46]|nr:MAG: 30S ribosomal protein S20 [Candidatus Eisenbacteria bacterium RBG_16_71_46]OGF24435.1 MAG: 30S ribosomal protein S20 [Candidatus Eisenbacteria bacterium RBG_19FT_COMBO_70_11]